TRMPEIPAMRPLSSTSRAAARPIIRPPAKLLTGVKAARSTCMACLPGITEQGIEGMQQAQYAAVGDTVVDVLAFAPGGHQPFAAQHAELLGEAGLLDAQALFQIAHAQFRLAELA